MQKTLAKCAVLGGIVVFIWGIVSWMVLPWHASSFNKFTNEMAVAEAIQQNAPQSGLYLLPNLFSNSNASKDQMQQGMNMMNNGPVVFASVQVNGVNQQSMLGPMVLALVMQIIGAGIVTWMLLQTKALDFRKRVGFVTLFGFAIGWLGMLPEWNWWGFAGSYVVMGIIDLVIGWFLAGLVIARCMRK